MSQLVDQIVQMIGWGWINAKLIKIKKEQLNNKI